MSQREGPVQIDGRATEGALPGPQEAHHGKGLTKFYYTHGYCFGGRGGGGAGPMSQREGPVQTNCKAAEGALPGYQKHIIGKVGPSKF